MASLKGGNVRVNRKHRADTRTFVSRKGPWGVPQIGSKKHQRSAEKMVQNLCEPCFFSVCFSLLQHRCSWDYSPLPVSFSTAVKKSRKNCGGIHGRLPKVQGDSGDGTKLLVASKESLMVDKDEHVCTTHVGFCKGSSPGNTTAMDTTAQSTYSFSLLDTSVETLTDKDAGNGDGDGDSDPSVTMSACKKNTSDNRPFFCTTVTVAPVNTTTHSASCWPPKWRCNI
jgi:hypothetical protein